MIQKLEKPGGHRFKSYPRYFSHDFRKVFKFFLILFIMTKTLDSSQVLISENYRGEVKEVALTKSKRSYNSLDEAIDDLHLHWHFNGNTIVNVVFGEPKKNEPRPAINLTYVQDDKCRAILIEDNSKYGLYYAVNGFQILM